VDETVLSGQNLLDISVKQACYICVKYLYVNVCEPN
jgi:hypothetical protein